MSPEGALKRFKALLAESAVRTSSNWGAPFTGVSDGRTRPKARGANADAYGVWRWGDCRGRLSLSKIELNAISDPHATMSVDPTLRAANDSGFPLQIAIERQVQNTSGEHGWTVRYSEHSWSNNEGQSGFIDMVLQDKYKSLFAVVECKRVRDAEWVFLHSAGRAPVERNAKGWVSHYASGSMKQFEWHELAPFPACVEAEYCAIRGQSGNDRSNLLERVGAELVVATEALAAEERDLRSDRHESIKFYVSVIVTTADLKLARFDPAKISLTDGTIPEADTEFESVPYLRFRKQLSTRQMRFSTAEYNDSTNIPYIKQHTVFVVRADQLARFLGDLCVPDSSVRRF